MPVEYRYATETEQLEALTIVQQQYVTKGYVIPPCRTCGLGPCYDGNCRLPYRLAHHGTEHCRVFVAVDADRILATVSLAIDGPLGLPCEMLFPEKVEELRQQCRLCEGTCFAAVPGISGRIAYGLAKHTIREGIPSIADVIIVECHPHHVEFWERLGADFSGRIVFHPTLENAPAAFGVIREVRTGRKRQKELAV